MRGDRTLSERHRLLVGVSDPTQSVSSVPEERPVEAGLPHLGVDDANSVPRHDDVIDVRRESAHWYIEVVQDRWSARNTDRTQYFGRPPLSVSSGFDVGGAREASELVQAAARCADHIGIGRRS